MMKWVIWKAFIQSYFSNNFCFKQDLTGLLKNLFKYASTRRKEKLEALNTMDDDEVSNLKGIYPKLFY